jgi:hypothetical protein
MQKWNAARAISRRCETENLLSSINHYHPSANHVIKRKYDEESLSVGIADWCMSYCDRTNITAWRHQD